MLEIDSDENKKVTFEEFKEGLMYTTNKAVRLSGVGRGANASLSSPPGVAVLFFSFLSFSRRQGHETDHFNAFVRFVAQTSVPRNDTEVWAWGGVAGVG